MKKCPKCGAVQNDSRQTCVDCGTLLGKPLDEREEEEINDQLDESLDGMSERTEDFYVPLRDKIFSVLAALGIVAALVLLALVGKENARIKPAVQPGTIVAYGSTSSSPLTEVVSEELHSPVRRKTVETAGTYALIALVSLAAALPLLAAPKLMWLLATWKYRMFYNWDTTPSDYSLIVRKVFAYLFFFAGMIGILYGYVKFFV